MIKRIVAYVLMVCMLVSFFPMVAQASEVAGGKCGDNATWSLNEDGILSISGTGDIAGVTLNPDQPWYEYRNSIKSIVVNEGITKVGRRAFSECPVMEKAVIANSVETIDEGAFASCRSMVSCDLGDGVETIDEGAFGNCSALRFVDLGETGKNIEMYAFTGCGALDSIYLSKDVIRIGSYAFESSRNLKVIYYSGTEEEWNSFMTKTSANAWKNYFRSATKYYNVPADGYKAQLSTLTNSPKIGDILQVNVGVKHGTKEYFNATEMKFTFDASRLSFNPVLSKLGEAKVKISEGNLVIEDYGNDKSFGTAVYELAFDTVEVGNSTIVLEQASFADSLEATQADLNMAICESRILDVTIGKRTFSVEMEDIFTGNEEAIEGENYIFSATDYANYTYDTVSATMSGNAVDVIDNEDGTYTVANVTGNLVISGERTPKSYSVSFAGNAKTDIVNAVEKATYGVDYTFNLPVKQHWSYTVDKILIGGMEYDEYSVENAVCKISGIAITGNIEITVNKEQVSTNVTIEGTGVGTVTGDSSVEMGEDYTFSVESEQGYVYDIKAFINGVEVAVLKNENGTYTIKNINGDLKIIVNKLVDTEGSTVDPYVTLNGTKVWLVSTPLSVAEGKVPTYDGDKMFWSEKYKAFCCLVVADTLPEIEVSGKIDISDGEPSTVNYSGDVNCTGVVDASDAQLVYDVYKAKYSDFNIVSMEKFLRADTNGDGIVDMTDAQAIISEILK